jgi:MFS family permease
MEHPAASSWTWTRTFAGIVAALFGTFTAFGAAIPVIPRLVTERLHGPPLAVGAAFTASAATALLVRPYAGRLAQRFGARPVMIAGCGLAVAVAGGYPLPLGLPGLLAVRMIMGVGEALMFTAGSVWTVALAPAERRGQIIGLYGLALWGGLTAGPALGELLYRTGSYPRVWACAAALPAAAAALLARLPRGPRLGAGVSRGLLPRAAVLPGLALCAGAYGYATVAGFGALALAARGIGGGPVLLSVFGGGYVAARLAGGRLPDRLGPLPVVVASCVVEAAGLALVAAAPAWWAAALGALLAGAGCTLLYPALALITIDTVPAAGRGAALGAIASFFDVGVGIGGFAGGMVAGQSYPAAFWLAAAVVLGGLAAGTAAAGGRNAPDTARPDPAPETATSETAAPDTARSSHATTRRAVVRRRARARGPGG